jgi:hypothetical protein
MAYSQCFLSRFRDSMDRFPQLSPSTVTSEFLYSPSYAILHFTRDRDLLGINLYDSSLVSHYPQCSVLTWSSPTSILSFGFPT